MKHFQQSEKIQWKVWSCRVQKYNFNKQSKSKEWQKALCWQATQKDLEQIRTSKNNFLLTTPQ
jgi:hypothetical protein